VEARVHESDKYTVCSVAGFKDVSGYIELGGCRCGDVLVSINGENIGSLDAKKTGEVLKRITAKVKDSRSYPLTLEFARPATGGKKTKRRSSAGSGFVFDLKKCDVFTVCVKEKNGGGLGFKLDTVSAAKGKSGMTFSNYFFIR